MNTNNLKFTTGERLVQLREKFGLSQAQVASSIGVDRTSYAKYEKNVNKPTRKLKELSELFKVTTDYIMCLSEHPYGTPFAGQDNGHFLVFKDQIFAIRLKKLCQKNKTTQKELEKISGVSLQVIEDWEYSKRMPDALTLSKLASFFNVSVDYLLGRTDEPGGLQKGLLGDINDDSPFMQKVREQMANIQVTPYEKALLNAYRVANERDKKLIDVMLNPIDKINADDKYTFIHDTLTNLMGLYCERDNKNQYNEPGDFVWLYESAPESEGLSSTPQIREINVLCKQLTPILNSVGAEQQEAIKSFINDTFHHSEALASKAPYISENALIGVSKRVAEKHMQKRMAELTADQSQEGDNPQQKPTKEKQA